MGPHLKTWTDAWLDRRCAALGLNEDLQEVEPPTQRERYDVLGLDAPTREWRDRANGDFNAHVWLKRWYRPFDRVQEVSLKASPFLSVLRAKEREYPVRIPAEEVNTTRRILW